MLELVIQEVRCDCVLRDHRDHHGHRHLQHDRDHHGHRHLQRGHHGRVRHDLLLHHAPPFLGYKQGVLREVQDRQHVPSHP